jgi:hypothetical protein
MDQNGCCPSREAIQTIGYMLMNNGTGCGTCNGDNDNAEIADGNANAQNGCCNGEGEEEDKGENKSEGKLINYIIIYLIKILSFLISNIKLNFFLN